MTPALGPLKVVVVSPRDLLDVLIWVGVFAGGWALARPDEEVDRPLRSAPRNVAWGVLLVILGLLLANQICFCLYVFAAHDGDPSFIARYLPPLWFQLPDWAWLRFAAAEIHDPDPLAWSVLRIQAVLEVPFTLAAYAAASWFVDPRLPRRLCGWSGYFAVGVHTAAWCAIELELRNPYTDDDLVARVVGALVAAAMVAAGRRLPAPGEGWSADLPGIFLRLIGVGAVAVLTVIVAWVALCYNLGLLGVFGPPAVACVLLVFWLAARVRLAPSEGGFLTLANDAGAGFCVAFLPASIPIHEQLGYDSAGWMGFVAIFGLVGWSIRRHRNLPVLISTPTAGLMALVLAVELPPLNADLRIVLCSGVFLGVWLLVGRGVERWAEAGRA